MIDFLKQKGGSAPQELEEEGIRPHAPPPPLLQHWISIASFLKNGRGILPISEILHVVKKGMVFIAVDESYMSRKMNLPLTLLSRFGIFPVLELPEPSTDWLSTYRFIIVLLHLLDGKITIIFNLSRWYYSLPAGPTSDLWSVSRLIMHGVVVEKNIIRDHAIW